MPGAGRGPTSTDNQEQQMSTFWILTGIGTMTFGVLAGTALLVLAIRRVPEKARAQAKPTRPDATSVARAGRSDR